MSEQNPSIAMAEFIVDALVASGVRHVVYCPGSRSAPFAYALDAATRRGQLRTHVRLDERSAAFLALGLSLGGSFETARVLSDESKSVQPPAVHPLSLPTPVAIVTTSGSAVAELHPAVAEAFHAGVPLIVVSADRPAELRGVAASQTTTQQGLFGPHVRVSCEVSAGSECTRELRASVERVVHGALGAPVGEVGPAHLNVCLREPLTPTADSSHSEGDLAASWTDARTFFACQPQAIAWEDAVLAGKRTVILAGAGANPEAVTWAERAGLPLLAEPASGLFGCSQHIPHQQTLISSSHLGGRVEQVVVTGRPTLSRAVSALVSREDVRVVVESSRVEWPDFRGNVACVVPRLAAPGAACERCESPRDFHSETCAYAEDESSGWYREWKDAAEWVSAYVDRLNWGEETHADFTMLRVAQLVWELTEGPLVLGASNPVRAVDLVASGAHVGPVFSNRGLAGIDGTVATGIGVGIATGQRTTVLVGDLTFLHDAGALSIPQDELSPDCDFVVVDDHGGGIFAGLEHGEERLAQTFNRWFATPQDTDIEALARAYGVAYAGVESCGELRELLGNRRGIRGIRILHIRLRTHAELYASVRNALSNESQFRKLSENTQ